MKASIDIENSKTKKVISLKLNIIEYYEDKKIVFDISNLNNNEIIILKDAISKDKEYTDIEMFFIDNSNIPEFGPDYNFYINDSNLIGIYNKNK